MRLSDFRFWVMGILVAVILPFGNATHGQSTTAKKNKVLIYPAGTESISQLKEQGITNVVNYGSYWLVEATDDQVTVLKDVFGKRVENADYLNKVELAATSLDTTTGELNIPKDLQQGDTTGKRLRIVQFKGPILPQWMKQLEGAGKVINYIPNNAYVVWLDQTGEAKLTTQLVPNGPIQWIGSYHPYYKIQKDLLSDGTTPQSATIKVRVAMVADTQITQTETMLQSLGSVQSSSVLNGQEIIQMDVSPLVVSQIAQFPDVLWIGRVEKKKVLDEMQALVMAGQTNYNNSTGYNADLSYSYLIGSNAPTPPPPFSNGVYYLEFLTNAVGGGLESFTDPTTYPVVDVADTGLDNGIYYAPMHPSFYYLGDKSTGYSRVHYCMPPWTGGDPVTQFGCQTRINEYAFRYYEAEDHSGHGTLVASVLAGYDMGTNIYNQPILELETNYPTAYVAFPIDGTVIISNASVTITNSLTRAVLNGNQDLLTTPATCSDLTNSDEYTLYVQFPTGVMSTCNPNHSSTGLTWTITTNLCPTNVTATIENIYVVTNLYSEYRAGYASDMTGTNAPYADTFHFCMGVSPFGRIGVNRVISRDIYTYTSGSTCQLYDHPQNDMCMNDLHALIAEAYGSDARIQNNSWADSINYYYSNGGLYTSDCQTFDTYVRDAVTSVTTNGSTPGPSGLNQEFVVVFACNSFLGDPGSSGSDVGGFIDMLVTAPATAKNVISVGCAENPWYSGYNSLAMSAYSAPGPTADGRFKPEIVAPGRYVYGADSQIGITGLDDDDCATKNLYPYYPYVHTGNDPSCSSPVTVYSNGGLLGYSIWSAGSSYAAPAVSGGIQLLWWYFQNRLTNEVGQALLQPTPAMAKAYLCNSARYLPVTSPETGTMDTLPSTFQGMGELDLRRMFDGIPRVLRDESTPHAIDVEMTTTNPAAQQAYFSQSGQSYEVSGQVLSNDEPFRVTVAWTDAPGDPSVFKQLVNDLDLTVIVGGQTYKGNVFVEDHSVTGGAYDDLNNMESVFLPAGGAVTSGAPYTVIVQAANIAGDGVINVGASLDQDFALVVYNSATNFATLSDVPNLATNNSCQTAMTITSGSLSFTNTLSKSVYHNVQPSPSAGRGGADEFFKIPLPTPGGVFTIDTTGSTFDNVLSVWQVQVIPQSIYVRGECGALIELASSAGKSSQVTFTADGSNDYFIVAEPHNDGAGGTLVLNVSATAPAISVSPSSLTFGDQILGLTSDVQTVTYENNTSVKVGISDVSITGSNAADFIIESQGCSGSIGSGQNCSIDIAFAPTTNGTETATLVITDDATGSPRSVPLSGNGLESSPYVCLSSSSIAFGSAGVGRTSAAQTITITNCGTAALNINSIIIGGTNTGDFAITSSSCSNVEVGSNCAVEVTFTPTDSGVRSADLTINDDAPNNPQRVSLNGTGIGCTTITVLPSTAPTPVVGIPYSESLTVNGATLPVTYALAVGPLPTGLTLSTNGVISGTATAIGKFDFEVGVTDANSCAGVKWYSVTIACPSITVSPSSLPSGGIGTAYSQTITAAGGVSPYTYAQTAGSLPTGMSLSSAGVLSGTPTSGSSSFTVTVTDANGCQGSRAYTISLANPSSTSIAIDQTSLPNGTVSNTYSQTLSASGGTAPYSFAITSGALPTGLTLSSEVITGTPTASGTFDFTVTATDAYSITGSQAYALTICSTIEVAPVTPATGMVSSVYSQTLSASGGTAPYSFAVTSGALPGGLALSSVGTLSGTPTAAGTFSFGVTATDSNGCEGSQSCSLVIVSEAPDLKVSISAGSTVVFVLDSVTYTVAVTNNGSVAATGVVMTNTLPSGAELVSVATSQGSYTQLEGAVSCSLGSLSAGHSALATIVVTPGKAGVLTDSATVGANETDANMTDNNATNSAVTVLAAADVDMTGVGVSVVQTGKLSAKSTYTVTAKLTCLNQGAQTSPAAKVRLYLSSTNSLGSGAVVLGKDLSTGKLKAGKSRNLTFKVKLPSGTTGVGKYAIAVIDPDNWVSESDKTNNTIVMGPIL